MDRDGGSGEQPQADRELSRIRSVYRRRDEGKGRGAVFAAALARIHDQRRAAMEPLLRSVAPPPGGRILDVGCGAGGDLAAWAARGWSPLSLAGVDVVAARVAAARRACPRADVRLVAGGPLPFHDGTFDAATASTVFSSILDLELRRAVFAEMVRTVRPGGLVLVYDFVVRKPTNRDVTGLSLARLAALGRPPDTSRRLSPVLQVVALAMAVHPRLGDLALRLAPPTHRLSCWRVAPRA